MPLFPIIILAGGLATRLRPVTEKIPKALIDINGEPFISHQLRLLHSQGIKDVIICAGFLGHMIQEFVGDGAKFHLNVQYAFDGEKLLGTGGAIKKALPLLNNSENNNAFFVLYGDSYLMCDYALIQKHFITTQKQALMTVYKNNNSGDHSNVEFCSGEIKSYDKKNLTPNMHYIDYGLGILTTKALDKIPYNEPFDLALLYQLLLKDKELASFEVFEKFYEVGSFSGIEDLTQLILQRHTIHPNHQHHHNDNTKDRCQPI